MTSHIGSSLTNVRQLLYAGRSVPEGLIDGSQVQSVWEKPAIGNRPVGNDVRSASTDCGFFWIQDDAAYKTAQQLNTNQTVPYRTDLISNDSRHFVPGYLQLVPLGRSAFLYRPC